MYFSFYGLKEKPFQISTDPRFLWLGEKHKEALATLRYGILDNKGFLLLTGDVGTGKTTLINALLNIIGNETVVATVPDPNLEKLDFYNYIGHAFKLGKEFTSKGTFLVYFSDFLHETYNKGKKILLIIDEAQRIHQELLEEIRLLSNFERQDTKLLNIFFVGQIEFNSILLHPENRAIRQRITVNYNIEPLTADETEEYIQHRLKIAGCTKKLFNTGALKAIFAFSKGYPRLINIICDRALLTGYVEEAKTINAHIVKECAAELQIPGNKSLSSRHSLRTDPGAAGRRENPPLDEQGTKGPSIVAFMFLLVALIGLAGGGLYYYQFQQRPFLTANTPEASPSQPLHHPVEEASRPSAPSFSAAPAEKALQQMESDKNNGAQPETEGNNMQPSQPPSVKSEQDVTVEKPSVEAVQTLEAPISPKPHEQETNNTVLSPIDLANQKLVINFGVDSILPTDESLLELSQFADRIMEEAPHARITIKGYTDSTGAEQYNTKLSEFRANVVKGFLVGRGISTRQIISVGMGSKNPISSNATRQGRITNRRVEVEVSP